MDQAAQSDESPPFPALSQIEADGAVAAQSGSTSYWGANMQTAHIAFNMTKSAESVQFYRDVLGMQIVTDCE